MAEIENAGSPDLTEIADKLEARKKQLVKSDNDGYVKMTIYVREDVARAFNALITRRGQQKQFVNEALKDFIEKKIRELDLD